MAEGIRALAILPGDLSSTSGTHTVVLALSPSSDLHGHYTHTNKHKSHKGQAKRLDKDFLKTTLKVQVLKQKLFHQIKNTNVPRTLSKV